MTDFVGDREALTVEVVQGIDADYWNAVPDKNHARQFFIQRRISQLCAKLLGEFVDGYGELVAAQFIEETFCVFLW